jgi:Leucine-rich repeat (LRR) protein
MSDIQLKIRRFKRGGDTKLDISGMGLTEVPREVNTITNLTALDMSNNKIKVLSEDIMNLEELETLRLSKNPIAVTNTELAVIFGKEDIRDALSSYFSDVEEISPAIGGKSAIFLDSKSNLNDVSFLRKKIADLQMELSDLKGKEESKGPKRSLEGQRDWLSSAGGRPQTASNHAKKLRDMEEDLRLERTNTKKLTSEVRLLKSEITKASILSSASGEEGTIGIVPGVMEIEYNELDLGDQIGQGGFSVIKEGQWRGTDIAVKIIFDPVITEELIAEVRNEVQMLSILRHPKIVMLMGMSSRPPNLAIVFENMPRGCLFDLLHTTGVELSIQKRLEWA